MRIWSCNPKTGNFPPLRIAWNLFWAIPAYFSMFVFIFFCFMQGGPTRAEDAWDRLK
jgi:hypothetical protein